MTDSRPDSTPERRPWSAADKALITAIGLMTLVIFGSAIAAIVHLAIGGDADAPFETRLAVPGEVSAIALDGDRIGVLVSEDGERTIRLYDAITGREEGRLRLETPRR